MTRISDQKLFFSEEDVFWKKVCISGLQERTFLIWENWAANKDKQPLKVFTPVLLSLFPLLFLSSSLAVSVSLTGPL